MLRTLHAGSLESIPELDATDSRNRKDRMSDHRLDPIPERLSISRIDIRNRTLYHRTEAVTLLHGLIYQRLPFRFHRNPSQLHDPGIHTSKRHLIQHSRISQNLLRHDSGSNHRQCKPSRKMSPTARILAVIPLQGSRQVGMARTRHSRKKLIIR